MGKKYYHKENPKRKRKIMRLAGLIILIIGLTLTTYVFWPLVSWQIYFAPAFASQNVAAPIPKTNIISKTTINSLLSQASANLNGKDYSDAQNWFPKFKYNKPDKFNDQYYYISIPKLNINNVLTSGKDYDLTKHLVNYSGTALPPNKGTAVIFGHSTLPQMYKENNFKTVFTYLYELTPGDQIIIDKANSTYKYRVENIIVVDPEDTSVFEQDYSDSFISLITCTPPGTIWKRLVVNARLEK